MKTFEFEIQELLSRIVEVEAKNEDEAYRKVKEIVLDSSDFVDTEINKIENE